MHYVTDTHALIWYLTDDPCLPRKAKRIFSEDYIVIPCIALFELLYLIEKKKFEVNFAEFLSLIAAAANYRIEPLCLPIIEKSQLIPREKVTDPWDRLIAATAIHLNYPLITRDKKIKEIGVEIIWQ
ncbi:MAG: type II toxin-antitoxin system VapC family toxin [candidate division WOR-3 bacterium]